MRRLLPLLPALLLLAIACGGDDKDGGALPPPSDVLAKAQQRLSALKTFHFKLSQENSSIPLPLPIPLRLAGAEGDVAVPDRLSAQVEAQAGGLPVRVSVISVGDRTWITNPFTRQYERLPGNVSLREVTDPAALVAAALGALKSTKVEGIDSVDGVDSYRVSGEVDGSALQRAFTFVEPGLSVKVDVWVGKEDSLVRRIRLSGPLISGEPANARRELSLSRFDAPVNIQAPD
jgi:hypothetical protein